MEFYHDNKFYDFVFFQVDDPIPSVSGFKKLWGRLLLQHRDTKHIHEFSNGLRDYLHEHPEFHVPFKNRVLISLAIGLKSNEYSKRDIDNMAKSLLDALEGVVYTNDNQVATLHVVKYVSDDNRFNLGIKLLSDNEELWHFPWLYDESPYGQASSAAGTNT